MNPFLFPMAAAFVLKAGMTVLAECMQPAALRLPADGKKSPAGAEADRP